MKTIKGKVIIILDDGSGWILDDKDEVLDFGDIACYKKAEFDSLEQLEKLAEVYNEKN